MGGGVISSAAVCQVTVPVKVWNEDVVLQVVLNLAPRSQVKVVVVEKKKGGDGGLSMTDAAGTRTISERNAILRHVSGMGLLNQMLGASLVSFECSAMARASITSWMSVAAHIDTLQVPQLDAYLSTRAFLVPSATPTLADLDVSVALLQSPATHESHIQGVHVNRWLRQCVATLQQLQRMGAQQLSENATAAVDLTKIVPATYLEPLPSSAPLFDYGPPEDESGAVAGTLLQTTPTTTVTPAVATNQAPKGKKDATPAASEAKPAASASTPAEAGGLTDEQKKAAADKRAKKAAEKAAKKGANNNKGGAANNKPADVDVNISVLDIRVGKLVKVWEHAEAEKLYCEEVDLGEGQPRQIASGLRPFYKSASDLEGKLVLVLCNLKKRNLVGFPSHGMVLCASNADHTKVEIVVPPPNATVGERITFAGFEGLPEAENKVAKKKLFEAVAPQLKTNAEGAVVWKDAPAMTSAGPVTAINSMANAHVA